MTERYDLVLTGQVVPGQALEAVKQRLAKLLRVDAAGVDEMLSQAPVVVKKNLTPEDARRYRTEFVTKTGAVAVLRPHAEETAVRSAQMQALQAQDTAKLSSRYGPSGERRSHGTATAVPRASPVSGVPVYGPSGERLPGAQSTTAVVEMPVVARALGESKRDVLTPTANTAGPTNGGSLKKHFDTYDLGHAERALRCAYPITMIHRGAFVAGVCFLAADVLLHLASNSPISIGVLYGIGALFILRLFAAALSGLKKRTTIAAAVLASVYSVLFPFSAVFLSAFSNNPYILILPYFFFSCVFVTITYCWWVLATISDRERRILRAPYSGVISSQGVFQGIPLITQFMEKNRGRTHMLFRLSALCVAFAVSTLTAGPLLAATSDTEVMVVIVLVSAVASVLFAALSNLLWRSARSKVRLSLERLREVDSRPPVLFLRAFRDDRVALPKAKENWLGSIFAVGFRPQSLDHLLIDEATVYGPVVALGSPKDAMPSYGAARAYFADGDWHQAFAALADAAGAIIFCIDDTESLRWELKYLSAQKYVGKTLFIIPPKFCSNPENAAMAHTLLVHGQGREAARGEDLQQMVERGGTIGIFADRVGHIMIGKSASFSYRSYLILLWWFFRTSLSALSATTLEAQDTAGLSSPYGPSGERRSHRTATAV